MEQEITVLPEQLYKDIEALGFQIKPCDRDGINGIEKQLYMDRVPDDRTLKQLFRLVRREYTLNFWDAFHRTISDPGAYCEAVVLSRFTVSYMEGNHGWSSDWKKISIKKFIRFVQKNWEKDIDWGDYQNAIVLEDNRYHLPRKKQRKAVFPCDPDQK